MHYDMIREKYSFLWGLIGVGEKILSVESVFFPDKKIQYQLGTHEVEQYVPIIRRQFFELAKRYVRIGPIKLTYGLHLNTHFDEEYEERYY